jgi:hypothetical protein
VLETWLHLSSIAIARSWLEPACIKVDLAYLLHGKSSRSVSTGC